MKVRHPEKINKPINPIKKKPDWIRTRIQDTKNYYKTKKVISSKSRQCTCGTEELPRRFANPKIRKARRFLEQLMRTLPSLILLNNIIEDIAKLINNV